MTKLTEEQILAKEKELQLKLQELEKKEEELKLKQKEQKEKEKAKKQVLLRLAPSLWEDLASWAEEDLRSINGQIEFLLREAVNKKYKK